MESIMEISEVTKSFGKLKALDSVSISNISGVHCLVGENGAGKTTLLRILATVLEKDSGNISHNDLLWDNVKEVKKNIGYLPQNFGMYRTLSVREALEHIAILKRVKGDIKEAVTKVIKQVNLEEKTYDKESEGGFRLIGREWMGLRQNQRLDYYNVIVYRRKHSESRIAKNLQSTDTIV